MFGSRQSYKEQFQLWIPKDLMGNWSKCFAFHKLALEAQRSGAGAPVWLADHKTTPTSAASTDKSSVDFEALVDNSVFVNLELGAAYQDHVRTTARKAAGQTVFLGNCMMALRYVLKRGGRGYFPAYLAAGHVRSGVLVRVEQSPDLMLPLYLVTRTDSAAFEDILDCLQGLRDAA